MRKPILKLIDYIDKLEQFVLVLMLPDITTFIIMVYAIEFRKKITNRITHKWN